MCIPILERVLVEPSKQRHVRPPSESMKYTEIDSWLEFCYCWWMTTLLLCVHLLPFHLQ